MKILVLNGPNLNLLGRREPDIYGAGTLQDIIELLKKRADESGVDIEAFQSNEEGALVSRIGEAAETCDGIIINPAAYTHTSIALRDAIKASELPCVEVHISNTYSREEFRHTSLTAPVCLGQIMGFGSAGYLMALDALTAQIKGENV